MSDQISSRTQRTDTERPDFGRYVHYDDGDWTVICDRSNPAAWIRSTELRPCRR